MTNYEQMSWDELVVRLRALEAADHAERSAHAEDGLRHSERHFLALAEFVPQLIWTTDPGGSVDYFNQRWHDYTGMTPAQSSGHGWVEALHPDDRARVWAAWQDRLGAREPIEIEYRLRAADGTYHWFLTRGVPLQDEAGRISRWFGTCTDVDRQKRAEGVLNEQARLAMFGAEVGRALTQNNNLASMLRQCSEAMVSQLNAAFARIWTLNERTQVLELQASSGMYTHLDGGHSRVPVGQFKIGLIASERKPHLTNAVIGDPRVNDQAWALREGMVAFAGYPLIVDNRLVGVMAMFGRQPLTEAVLQAMESVANSIALGIERKWTEIELRKLNEQLELRVQARTAELESANRELAGEIAERTRAEEQMRGLAAHLQTAREEERLSIAREMHDDLGQWLTVLKTDLNWLDRKYGEHARAQPANQPLAEDIRKAIQAADRAVQSMRAVLAQLRPEMLDEQGLQAAIQGQAQAFQTRTGVACEVRSSVEQVELQAGRALAVFRIVQEALTNVSRHAQATRVEIRIQHSGGLLLVEVQDNGRGIAEPDLQKAMSFGVVGMRERALMCGGEVTLSSAPGQGTTVAVRVPL